MPHRKSPAPKRKPAKKPAAKRRSSPNKPFSIPDNAVGRSIRRLVAAFGEIRSTRATAARIKGGEWPNVYSARVEIGVDTHGGDGEKWEGKGRGRTDEEAIDDALDDLQMKLPNVRRPRWGDAR